MGCNVASFRAVQNTVFFSVDVICTSSQETVFTHRMYDSNSRPEYGRDSHDILELQMESCFGLGTLRGPALSG